MSCGQENSRPFNWWRPSPNDADQSFPISQERRNYENNFVQSSWPIARCPKNPEERKECTISRDFWPDKGDRSSVRQDGRPYHPPWCPGKLPNKWGVVSCAPPYGVECRCTTVVRPSGNFC